MTESYDRIINIWDLNSCRCLNKLVNESNISCFCLISNNQLACGCENGLVNIWNINLSTIVKTFKARMILIYHFYY